MILDLIWAGGEVLSIVGLLSGAYIALMESEPFVSLSGRKSSAPLPLLPRDIRLIRGLASHGATDHSLSGNGAIDAQHQRLADYTEELRAAILSGRTACEVGVIIDALIRDMVQHFQEEEEILAAADYPETAKHAALHRELLASTTTLLGKYRYGRGGIGELFRFLTHDAFANHTRDADRAFILYLEGRFTIQKAAA